MTVLVERDPLLPFWIGSLFGAAIASTIVCVVLQLAFVCSTT